MPNDNLRAMAVLLDLKCYLIGCRFGIFGVDFILAFLSI